MAKKKQVKKIEKKIEKPVDPNGMTTWIKPNGTQISLNNKKATIAAAKEKGWKVEV